MNQCLIFLFIKACKDRVINLLFLYLLYMSPHLTFISLSFSNDVLPLFSQRFESISPTITCEYMKIIYSPSRARLRFLGNRLNCRFFGYDPTTLFAALISLPYHMPSSITGIKEELIGGVEGIALNGDIKTRHLSEVKLYRTFGTCRQAYAVTPQGARWMMATVLRSMIIDGWGSGGGDSILASAAIRDLFTHQTFFMRLFEQDEWCDPDNTFTCTHTMDENPAKLEAAAMNNKRRRQLLAPPSSSSSSLLS